ncbi:MAG: cob(I)yrinic acid a,c-diamide adenosyltransferase [Chloroflexi bacterium]|nr:cob(I)yrinic acid a,c-diamide adenosyltransferase [Chloroflexota bacterium]
MSSARKPAQPPERGAPRGPRVRRGLVIVNTGTGKGKTTAALGVLFRAWGRNFNVRMFQFIKHSTARFGEHRAAERIGLPIESLGDGFTWLSKDMDETTALAVDQWERCKEAILAGEEDLIVLDEFTYAMHYEWVAVDDVIDTLKRRPESMHVIITGRYAPQELIDYADLVTEMTLVKHPLADQGIKAQPGIEF